MTLLPVTNSSILIASTLIVVAGFASIAMRLGLAKRLWVAALRTVLQLAALGLVLEWVFSQTQWYWVAALLGSMVINAGVASVRRTERRFPGIWRLGLLSVSVSTVLTTALVVELALGLSPWYEPRYIIPLVGMVLGNTLNGLSLALDRLMSDLDEKRDKVDAWLALGATGWQASRDLVADALRTGLIPIINSMTVVGIVSLPGMMTGQILAGASPESAVRYQIIMMFMIAGSTSIGVGLVCLATWRRLVTRDHQLAHHLLHRL